MSPQHLKPAVGFLFAALAIGCSGDDPSSCQTGYVPVDGSCTDLDECASAGGEHDCHPNATCTNTQGSFVCACNPQYAGDGRTCIPAGATPRLFDFHVRSGDENQIRFRSTSNATGLTVAGFIVSGRTVDSVVLDTDALGGAFILSSRLTYWDNNTIRLEGGDGTVHDFTLEAVRNDIVEPATTGETYFVTTAGLANNDGLSEQSAWTIEHAVASATAGDTVYIKAGNYGDRSLNGFASGTAAEPIRFIGYRSSPGDIDSMYFEYGVTQALDAMQMPLLDHGNGGDGVAFAIRSDYVIVKNIQVTNYEKGFFATVAPEGVIFENCLAHTLGRTTGQPGNQGFGFDFNSHETKNCRILNSTVVNASIDNFAMAGSFNKIEGSKSYCDRDNTGAGEATDYYFVVTGSHNLFLNNHAERNIDNSHGGHGITWRNSGLQQEVHYNLAQDCTVVGIGGSIEFRHENIKYNVARRVRITGGIIPLTSSYPAYGPVFRDGASYNSVEDCTISGVVSGIKFRDNTEEDAQPSGEHNRVINTVISDCEIGIQAQLQSGSLDGTANNNEFLNCTFTGLDYLYSDSENLIDNGSNELKNSVIYNVAQRNRYSSGGMVESYNTYFGGFPQSAGEGNVSVDPRFTDATGDDFSLSDESSGEVTEGGQTLDQVFYDHIGRERTPPYSIGAFELD